MTNEQKTEDWEVVDHADKDEVPTFDTEEEAIVFDPNGEGETLIKISPWLMKDLLRQFRKAHTHLDPPKKKEKP